MVAKLIKKGNRYICSECFIHQPEELLSYCFFCGSTFSNYEHIIILKFKEENFKEFNSNEENE